MLKLLCYIILLFIISCSSEKPAEIGRQKPSAPAASFSLEINPVDAARNSTLYLSSKGFILSDAKVEWLVNGSPVISSSSEQFKLSDVKKGDKIQVKAIIQNKGIFSNIVQIKNALPEISKIKILPEVFKPGDTLYVEATGVDADGEEVAIYYEWSNNGKPAGNSRQIEAPIKRGDKVSIKITPFDGEAYGKPVVLHREIKNLPPVILEDNKYNFDGKVYAYQVKASDPDGDTLAYSLKLAPSGMTINPATGFIQWNVPADFGGKAAFTVSAADGHGGESTYHLAFEIKTGKK